MLRWPAIHSRQSQDGWGCLLPQDWQVHMSPSQAVAVVTIFNYDQAVKTASFLDSLLPCASHISSPNAAESSSGTLMWSRGNYQWGELLNTNILSQTPTTVVWISNRGISIFQYFSCDRYKQRVLLVTRSAWRQNYLWLLRQQWPSYCALWQWWARHRVWWGKLPNALRTYLPTEYISLEIQTTVTASSSALPTILRPKRWVFK